MPEQIDLTKFHDQNGLMSNISREGLTSLRDVCQWASDEGKEIIVTSRSGASAQDKYYSMHISSQRILFVDKSAHSKQELEFNVLTGFVSRNGQQDNVAEDRLIERLRKVQGDIQRNDAQVFGRKVNAST